ncbi:MAG TPA: prolipoprotein diacylglyceryl transferase family protein [Rubricoccaceae bacterium]|nr:prolipoprotein diacylglyceryl transferase family protein [Rubricoccaceae bacterium]
MYPRLSDLFRDLFGVNLPLPIYSFGFMVALGLLAAAAVLRKELDRMHAAGQVGSVRVKGKDAKGREKVEQAPPSALVWTMMGIAAAVGVLGSKLLHILDYWGEFVENPGAMLLSASGLSFFGGLICASFAIAWYVHKKGLSIPRMADAIAPTLLLGYGIGRIGCYLAGDGDWGVCSDPADKPGFLPTFLWTEDFPRNILGEDLAAQCPGGGVYPAMLYETFMALALFGVLWAVRKHPFKAGWLFSLYLVFAAVERFLIEFIRVNPDRVGTLSQAQLIAIGLFVLGLIGLAFFTRRAQPTPPAHGPTAAPNGAPAAA